MNTSPDRPCRAVLLTMAVGTHVNHEHLSADCPQTVLCPHCREHSRNSHGYGYSGLYVLHVISFDGQKLSPGEDCGDEWRMRSCGHASC